MKKVMALLALTILTACDYAARRDLGDERDNRLYRAAMDDYSAGRLDAAMAGLEKAVRQDPANASARFQLACLMQDRKKDFVSAYFGYREYLLQHPESDRARMAKDRMAICEKEMARELSVRHGFNSAEGIVKQLDAARAEIAGLKDRVAAAEKNLGVSQERVRSLSAEKDRLLAVIKGEDDSAVAAGRSGVSKEVLAEKKLLEAEEETGTAVNVLAEKKLLEEEEKDEVSTGSSLIPVRRQTELAKRESAPADAKKDEGKAPPHPKTYVVQEGDTLYGVAKRFYGTVRAWKVVREANKTLISGDNRLKAGDTIVLP